ncbi:MAG: hypothetical protein LBP62_02230 [Clostridiales bacterium]|nr:hypothetical protein [Clostridiales bacterium]
MTHFNGISLIIRNSPPWEGIKGVGRPLGKSKFFHSKRGERKFPSVGGDKEAEIKRNEF